MEAVRRLPEGVRGTVSRLYEDQVYVALDVTLTELPPRVVYVLEDEQPFGLNERNLWRVNLLPDLEYLNLFNSTISAEGLAALDNRSLRSLCLPALCLCDAAVELLIERQSAPQISHLDLPAMTESVTPNVMGVVTGLRRVYRIEDMDRWHRQPVGLDRLESLHLLGPRVSDQWLRWLKDHACEDRPHPQGRQQGKQQASPSLYVRLRGFGLRGTSVSDGALDYLAVFRNLTHLAIVDSPGITTEGVKRLKALPRLEELHLTGKQFTDAALGSLPHLPGLRVLVLDFSPVTQEGLKVLEGLEHLEFLSVVGTKIPPQAAQEWQRAHPRIRTLRLERPPTTYALQGWIHQGPYGLWNDLLFAPVQEISSVRALPGN